MSWEKLLAKLSKIKQEGGFMLLGTLVVNLLENLLIGKGVKAKIPGRGVITPGEGKSRAGQHLNPPHPLPNSEMQSYYQNDPKFSGVYLRNNLQRIRHT